MVTPRYRPARNIAYRALKDGGVLLDLQSGRYYGLNPTAAFIWAGLVEGSKSPEDYAAAFGVDADRARSDFDALAADLQKRGFLVA